MFIRPNWRDPEPYKSISNDDVANVQMAWEFLRRNPLYQADSKKFLKEVCEYCFENQKELQETYGFRDYSSRLGSMVTCFMETCGDRSQYWQTHFDDVWGVPMTVVPTDDDAWDFFKSSIDSHAYPSPGDEERFKPVHFGKVHGPLVLIPVDLSTPLETLLHMVEGQIRELREAGMKQGTVTPRVTRVLSNRVYIEQLRILDAFTAGATVNEIGEVILPVAINDPESKQRDKRIKAAYQAALKMQNGGYRTLIPDL